MAANSSANELLRKVRKIEIRTRALSHQIFAGEYHSAFKGRGMAFSEVREYQYGDDVRSMDWNVTARLRSPYVKVFEEEREMTVVLLIDISRSGLFGTSERTKRDLIAEIAAVLSFSAIINNDKVGALFFSDRVEEFIPPKKGRSHLLHIIREIIELKPKSNGTDVGQALRYLTNAMKKKCTAFVLSDMLDANPDGSPRYEDALKVAATVTTFPSSRFTTLVRGRFRMSVWCTSRTLRQASRPGSIPPARGRGLNIQNGSVPSRMGRGRCSTAIRLILWTSPQIRIMSKA